MAAPAFPKQFGKYTLIRKLATGGMAELFVAKTSEDDGDEREVVLKRILPSFSEDESFVKMFIDEASLTSKLQHPNIVQIFDFDVTDRQYYISMEFIQGEDLSNLMKDGVEKGTPLSIPQSVWIVIELAKGLHYAHTKEHKGRPLNIIHRDVTPHNAMVSYDGEIKLMDFGIAKAAERSTKTQAGMVKGKVAYMSPEQARGKPLDPRSDLFALATVLWEMLTHKRLYLRSSDFETLTAILKEEAEPPSKYRKGIDQELDDIIGTALEKDREHRQASVEVFARELTRWYYKHVTDPESESIRGFMHQVFAEKVAKLPRPANEPATVRAGNDSGARRQTGRVEAAMAAKKGEPSASSSKPAARTLEASVPEVLKASAAAGDRGVEPCPGGLAGVPIGGDHPRRFRAEPGRHRACTGGSEEGLRRRPRRRQPRCEAGIDGHVGRQHQDCHHPRGGRGRGRRRARLRPGAVAGDAFATRPGGGRHVVQGARLGFGFRGGFEEALHLRLPGRHAAGGGLRRGHEPDRDGAMDAGHPVVQVGHRRAPRRRQRARGASHDHRGAREDPGLGAGGALRVHGRARERSDPEAHGRGLPLRGAAGGGDARALDHRVSAAHVGDAARAGAGAALRAHVRGSLSAAHPARRREVPKLMRRALATHAGVLTLVAGLAISEAGCDAGAAADPCELCASDERCEVSAGQTTCELVCTPPRLPRFAMLPVGMVLPLVAGAQVAVSMDAKAPVPDDAWQEVAAVTLDRVGATTVHARWKTRPEACAEDLQFVATYAVVEQLPAALEVAGASDAVALDDSRIVGWASGWARPARFGSDLEGAWKDITKALGPATGTWSDAVSLGNGGALTFTFDAPIEDYPGLDLAVFENGFSAAFLELAYVEVSSDGRNFARFPSLSLQTEAVAAYGTLDASELTGVAGRYAGGFGTGFDLACLADDDAVITDRVDLTAIKFVRVVDIVGDGLALDSLGRALYDPTPTFGPAGFDVEAIAVLRGEAP